MASMLSAMQGYGGGPPPTADPQMQERQRQAQMMPEYASMMQERPQQAFPAANQSFDPRMQQMMQERQQQALMQESPAFPQQMQMQQANMQRMQQAAPTLTGSLGSPIPQDLSEAQMQQAFMERTQQGPPPMQQAQQFLTPEQMAGQQQLRDPNGPRPQLMGALSSNDLQRQLNRGAVADENVGNVKSEITALNNASFTANQTQPPSNSPPPTPFFNRPEFQGMFGGGSDPRAAGQQQPQPMTGPNPSQIPQAPPQQQMAGGYGLSNYQDDQFSKGVMSLPQIQGNFYNPPAGGYNAKAIGSPYENMGGLF